MEVNKASALPLNRLIRLSAIMLTIQSFLIACDGGGGGKASPADEAVMSQGNGNPPPEHVLPPLSSPQQLLKDATITDDPSPITLDNSPRLLMALNEFLSLGEMLFEDFLKGDIHAPPIRGSDFDSGSVPCSYGGSFHMIYEGRDDRLTINFKNCTENTGTNDQKGTLSGTERISWIQQSGATLIQWEYYDYELATDEESVLLNGIAELVVTYSDEEPSYVNLNLEASDPAVGTIRSNMRINYLPKDGASTPGVPTDVSGRLAFETIGAADISFADSSPMPDAHARFTLTGSTESAAILDFGEPKFLVFGFDQNGDGASDHSTYFRSGNEYSSSRFVSTAISSPVNLNAKWNSNLTTTVGQPLTFNVLKYFTHEDGQLLTYSVELASIEDQSSNDNDQGIAADLHASFSITQPESGFFEFVAEGPAKHAVYTFEVKATGPEGMQSAMPVKLIANVYMDSDNDGTPDIMDSDSDNDGIPDSSDASPFDSSESIDSDGDGIGNNEDEDDDDDGYADTDDLRPLDPLCALPSDVENNQCLQRQLLYRQKLLDREGVLFLWNHSEPKIYRWNTNTGHFLEPLILNSEEFVTSNLSFSPYYSPDQHALYIEYKDALITRFDLTDSAPAELLYLDPQGLSLPGSAQIANTTGQYTIVRSADEINTEYSSLDVDGNAIDTVTSATTASRSFRSPAEARFCDGGLTINPETGKFLDFGADDCRNLSGSSGVRPLISPDGQRVITGDGRVLDTAGTELNKLQINMRNNSVQWTSDAFFYLDAPILESIVYRYSPDGTLLDRMTLSDTTIQQIFGQGDSLVIAVEDGKTISIRSYQTDE